VLDALGGRFDEPVTVLVAGAGFGKTTALAQAIRANEAEPRGVDAWVACEPGDEDAGRLSKAILAALGSGAKGGRSLDRIVAALGALAPVDVCILLDDLHELPPLSAGEQLVSELTAQLPPHAHLVLASRDPVRIPLARRRAAGQVVDIKADDLAFTDTEVAALAAMLAKDRTACDGLAGWPSLVRLVLSAPPGATREFLWEEIVAGLPAAERSGLLAVAMLGSGSVAEVTDVAGHDVDLDRLVRAVPLLHLDSEGRVGAHQLWEDAVERIFPAADVTEARRRVLRVLHDRGDTVRMGSAAVRWGDAAMFRVACVSLVRENLGALPVDTAARWLASGPPSDPPPLEQRLLGLALSLTRDRDQAHLDPELDSLEADFVADGDVEGQVVTLAVAAVSAQARGDTPRLAAVTQRITSLPEGHHLPLLQFFVGTFDAALAALRGDIPASLEAIDAMSFDGVPSGVRELVVRLHVIMLVLAGRADEAVSIGQSLLDSPNAFVRSIPSMLRWSAGDPTPYLEIDRSADPLPDVSHPYRFFRATHATVAAAALGDRGFAARMRSEVEASIGSPSDARDSALAAAAVAACHILDHDDDAARIELAEHLDRHPLTDARGEVHLRHNLALVYIACEPARRWFDSVALGPRHLRAREVARLLLEAREASLDRDTDLGSPGSVVTSLPLAWSVELAVRASGVGCPSGDELFRALATWLPAHTRREVEWLAAHGDTRCQASAARLLDDLPDPAAEPLAVDVLGPLRLREGEREVDRPELRRTRVRSLLALLVLRGAMRRERLCDLLWPDLDPVAGAKNLRVTLSHLRRLLEPDRRAGHSSWRIRGDTESVWLAGPPLVETDLARVERHLADAHDAERDGDLTEVIACLGRVVDLWRGDPLPDLIALDDLDIEVETVRRTLLDACLRLGELLLVAGRFDEALRCAERGRTASPYSERAHRLAIACQLQRRDRPGLESAVRSTRQLLDDLGVEPDEPTEMLLRRAAGRLGPAHAGGFTTG
jgi:DNA-binding SARP family transcriptional activator